MHLLLAMIGWPQPEMDLTTAMMPGRRVEAPQGTLMMIAPKLTMGVAAVLALGMMIGAPLKKMMTTTVNLRHLRKYFSYK